MSQTFRKTNQCKIKTFQELQIHIYIFIHVHVYMYIYIEHLKGGHVISAISNRVRSFLNKTTTKWLYLRIN